MTTYLFYDIETTGLNPAFDQILRFAAIRTQPNLEEIDRHLAAIRLRPDVIPSPQAVLTHGIGPADFDSGECEFDAVRRIHRWVNEPGTISIGYNSLGFDDEFLRFSFFRNLLPPYTHQYDNGCMRMDLFPMVLFFWLYRPQIMDWPEIDGKLSLKLEHINASNHFADGRAHDALSDTETTLALARHLIGETEMWNYLSGYFHKTTDILRTDKLPVSFESPSGEHRKALMISGEFGTRNRFQAPVLSIGKSEPYSNQTLWLRLDLPELRETTPDSIAESTRVVRKKMGEPGMLLPPHERYWEKLDPGIRSNSDASIGWLRDHPDLFREIIRFHRELRYPEIPDLDADAALYHMGFPDAKEKQFCYRFHLATLEEKVGMVGRLSGTVTGELAKRLLLRNYPGQLPKPFPKELSQFMKRINPRKADAAMVDYKGNRRVTPKSALSAIGRIKSRHTMQPQQRRLLDNLAVWIRETYGMERK